ncbi:MAG: hypothetical protein H6713_25525 [Myxococcales bacterium]|nr:hypothetical protein [Myxococcales bacterium]MCB9753315.1 hypothetical protein [Myxococcales bacterium]
MDFYPLLAARVSVATLAACVGLPSAVAEARPSKSMPGDEGVAGEDEDEAPDGDVEGPVDDTEEVEEDEDASDVASEAGSTRTATAGDSEDPPDPKIETGSIGRGPPIPTETPNMPREKLLKGREKLVEDLEVRVTGSISMSVNYRAWPNQEGDGPEGPQALFERVAVGLDGIYKGFIVSADYRFYRKYATVHHGYIGYRYGDVFEIDAGVHRVPFGILPYASHNWFETLPYYVGLADDYDLGLKSMFHKGGLTAHLAYYVQAEPSQFGATQDSARYSYDVVLTDETELGDSGVTSAQSNEEKHTAVGRIAYEWKHRGEDKTEIGASGQFGGLYNRETERFGTRWAAALHYTGWYRGFNFQLEGLYYDNRPQNPDGQPRTWLTMGAWDAPYRVARRGAIVVGNIAYRLPLSGRVFEWVMFYNDHSFLWKPDAGFDYSQMNTTGVLIANRYVYIYLDAATGRNHPWFNPEYGNALAEGEDDPHWWLWVNLSLGFYM